MIADAEIERNLDILQDTDEFRVFFRLAAVDQIAGGHDRVGAGLAIVDRLQHLAQARFVAPLVLGVLAGGDVQIGDLGDGQHGGYFSVA